MSEPAFESRASGNLLAARIALLTQPVQAQLGEWKIHSTAGGAVLAATNCGLGDAGFLPQALQHGGLLLRRIGADQLQASGVPPSALVVGEIQWPIRDDSGRRFVVQPPPVPLSPGGALAQPFSILIHAVVPSSLLSSKKYLKSQQQSLAEIEKGLACRCWHGIASSAPDGKSYSTLNLHLATKPDEPLSPYEFEMRAMPVLKLVSLITAQDGLLVRFDNPSTNWVVYCAAQQRLAGKAKPCPAGHRHPD